MKKTTNKGLNRRDFPGLSALGLTGLTILPSYVINEIRVAPSDRVLMGTIGLGRQALSDFRGFAGAPGLQVVACCDVDTIKQQRYKKTVEEWQKSKGLSPRCDTYEQYEQLLERKDIDVVEVVTPDHWHALMTIHACQAGKDVLVRSLCHSSSVPNQPAKDSSSRSAHLTCRTSSMQCVRVKNRSLQ